MKYKTAVHKNIIFHLCFYLFYKVVSTLKSLLFVLFYHGDIVSVGNSNDYQNQIRISVNDRINHIINFCYQIKQANRRNLFSNIEKCYPTL